MYMYLFMWCNIRGGSICQNTRVISLADRIFPLQNHILFSHQTLLAADKTVLEYKARAEHQLASRRAPCGRLTLAIGMDGEE